MEAILKRKKIFLRREIHNGERRTPLTPADVRRLVGTGWVVFVQVASDFQKLSCAVQESNDRCFSSEEYSRAGAVLTMNPWYNPAYSNFLIVGLKELDMPPPTPTAYKLVSGYNHIYFSHCWKGQAGGDKLIRYFHKTANHLYDFELVYGPDGKRALTFGFWAGVAGAALALSDCQESPTWESYDEMMAVVKKIANSNHNMKIAIIGVNGRCGHGVSFLLSQLGLFYDGFGSEDKIPDLRDYDIVFNCILLSESYKDIWFPAEVVKYINKPLLIVDVSCDWNKPNNPIPVYSGTGIHKIGPHLRVIAIDNLPSFLPRESSSAFSSVLTNMLLTGVIEPFEKALVV